MRPTRFAIVLGTTLLLAACGEEAAMPEGDDSRSAAGEVLEGTISDEMLALDKVRSQAPLLEAVERAAGDGTATTPAEGEAAEEPTPEEASAAAEPQPETFEDAFSEEG